MLLIRELLPEPVTPMTVIYDFFALGVGSGRSALGDDPEADAIFICIQWSSIVHAQHRKSGQTGTCVRDTDGVGLEH